MDSFRESREFKAVLRTVCQRTIWRFGHTQWRYRTVEDLEQQVRLRLFNWRPQYLGDPTRKRVFFKIAINLMIDAGREASGWPGDRAETDWTNFDIESLKSTSGTELDASVLLRECLDELSSQERQLFIEWGYRNRSSIEIANELGISRQAISKRVGRVLGKLKECIDR